MFMYIYICFLVSLEQALLSMGLDDAVWQMCKILLLFHTYE